MTDDTVNFNACDLFCDVSLHETTHYVYVIHFNVPIGLHTRYTSVFTRFEPFLFTLSWLSDDSVQGYSVLKV